MITIDGSYGEGGGQILRTALSLSVIFGIPVRIEQIRNNRKKPGLMPQHLTAVKALQEICQARVDGAVIGSKELSFEPGRVKPGEYSFDVGTAGSTSLIFQSLLLPLTLSGGDSLVRLKGGTHVPWSPPFHYLEWVFLPVLVRMGIQVQMKLKKWGWYPKGGGEIEARIKPVKQLMPLSLGQPWKPAWIKCFCASSHLPEHIREREKQQVEELLSPKALQAHYELIEGPSPGQGNIVFIAAGGGPGYAGFSSLGQRGKRAEQVAGEAVDSLLAFMESGASVEAHLADQLVPYLALAQGPSEILVQRISSHLKTNLWVVRQFCQVNITLSEEGMVGRLQIHLTGRTSIAS
ncbi:MAG: RNA 3'-phosphate cyclase [Deltaproteobacteria bacterium]|nr:RNA 3'-phosphate cyclase [Deltaproteobacteria bacterium]